MSYAQTKQQAHELIERMAPGQIFAVVTVMETMLDPSPAPLPTRPSTTNRRPTPSAKPSPLPRRGWPSIPAKAPLRGTALRVRCIRRRTPPRPGRRLKKIVITRKPRRMCAASTARLPCASLPRWIALPAPPRATSKAARRLRRTPLRVGDYRVRFNEEPPGTILVHAVLHRSEAYR